MRVVRNDDFLYQLQNYNHALRQISEESVYCKMVQADDWLFPRCLEEMVQVAESDHDVGVVGAMTLLDFGTHADPYLAGLRFPDQVFDGIEIARKYLLGESHVFGSPTATMFRSEIVRARSSFYDEDSVPADTMVCLEVLKDWKWGFLHQILTYTRRYNESFMSVLRRYHFSTLTHLIALRRFGREYLADEEYERRLAEVETEYHRALGESVLRRLPSEFWSFHRKALKEIGVEIGRFDLARWTVGAAFDLLLNPKQTVERLRRRWSEPPPEKAVSHRKVSEYVDTSSG